MPERVPVVESDYVGSSEAEATRRAEQAGWRVRAYARDSVMTADLRVDRLNLELDDDGTVVSARVF